MKLRDLFSKLSFAKEDKVDKKTLTSRRANPGSQSTSIDKLVSGMLALPPGAYGLDIRPTRSTSLAHGFLILANNDYFDLLDEMYESDEVLRMCLDLIVAYMLMRPQGIRVEEGDADEARAAEIVDFFEAKIVNNPECNFRYLLWCLALGMLIHGRSTVEIVWKVDENGAFVPDKFYHCHPAQFKFDREGNMYYADTNKPVERYKFVTAANAALYDNPFGKSELFPFRYKWQYKKRVLIAKLQYLERYGTPIVHGIVPKEVTEKEEAIQQFVDAIENLESGMAIVTALGEEIKVHQRSSGSLGGSDGVHDAILDRFDSYFVKALLGAELTTTVKDRGARSLGEVQERTVLNKILPVAYTVYTALNLDLFDPCRRFNFGVNSPVCRYWIDTEESTDAKDARDTLDCAVKNGVETTVRQAQEMLGIEARIGDEPVLKPRAQPSLQSLLAQRPKSTDDTEDDDTENGEETTEPERVELPTDDEDELAAIETVVTRRDGQRLRSYHEFPDKDRRFKERMIRRDRQTLSNMQTVALAARSALPGKKSVADIVKNSETKFAKREFAVAMLELSAAARTLVADYLINVIDENDFYYDSDGGKGPVYDTHCTVLYGLHEEVTAEQVESAVAGEFWQWVDVENLDVFSDPEREFDVLIMRVAKTQSLLDLRAALQTLPHTLTYSEYEPHITLAYLKKGAAQKYLDMDKNDEAWPPLEYWFEPVEWLSFESVDHEKTKIALTGPYIEMSKCDTLRNAQQFVKQVERSCPKSVADLWARQDTAGIRYREVRMSINREAEKQGHDWEAKIAQAAIDDTSPQLVAALKDTLSRLSNRNADERVSSAMKADVDISAIELETTARRIVFSTYMIRRFIVAQQLEGIAKDKPSFSEAAETFDDESVLDLLPDGFRDAADWLASRGVMTVAAVRELALAMTEQFGGDMKQYERDLREHYLAIEKAGNVGVTKKIQNLIEQSVRNGETLKDFLDRIGGLVSEGDLPAGLESYWETVFRTEVGNAYKAAQEKNESDPDFDAYHWGWEGYNPQDDRSEPSHAAIEGVLFKKGSLAAKAIGLPPFRYNCRCALFALTMPDPENPPYKESSNALSVAGRVTRF